VPAPPQFVAAREAASTQAGRAELGASLGRLAADLSARRIGVEAALAPADTYKTGMVRGLELVRNFYIYWYV